MTCAVLMMWQCGWSYSNVFHTMEVVCRPWVGLRKVPLYYCVSTCNIRNSFWRICLLAGGALRCCCCLCFGVFVSGPNCPQVSFRSSLEINSSTLITCRFTTACVRCLPSSNLTPNLNTSSGIEYTDVWGDNEAALWLCVTCFNQKLSFPYF